MMYAERIYDAMYAEGIYPFPGSQPDCSTRTKNFELDPVLYAYKTSIINDITTKPALALIHVVHKKPCLESHA